MSESIPLARPSLGDPERSAALRVLAQSRLTGGPERARFEAALSALTGRAHALAMSSGSAALEVALGALGVGPASRVLVTAFGFPAAASAALRLGAQVEAVDVQPETWTVDFARARQLCDERSAVLVTIDQLGLVTEAAAIEGFEAETGVAVLSDAACGLGGRDSAGRPAGSAGRLASFSFHPRKLITTGEGGALVCSDDELDQRIRALHNHGQSDRGVFQMLGTNARMDELRAAIGCAQLARLDTMLAERALLAAGYRERLAGLRAAGKLEWQESPAGARHAYQTFAVRLSPECERDDVVAALRARGIEAGPATYAFSELPAYPSAKVPNARALHRRALALPLFVGMRSTQLDRVAEALEQFLS